MGYPSDLKDKEWLLVEGYFKQKRVFGRPLRHDRRSIVNAIFYITRAGCQWRMLPKDYPPWQTVYDYFKQWCEDGTWEMVLDILNEKDRARQGRQAKPSYGIIDSQSAKTQYNSDERGIDGGKKGKRP
jgi:putative transposase